MIEEFSFGNFWSFKDIQTLNLTAAKRDSKNSDLDIDNLISINEDLSLLKSKAIYGANASGKSNIIKALISFLLITTESANDEKVLEKSISPFLLSTQTEDKPSFFQLIFRIGKTKYRYGFEADNLSIKSEWLFATPKKREQALFIRKGKSIIELNKTHFEEGLLYQDIFKNSKEPIFRENSLFLSHLRKVGFAKISENIIEYFKDISIISGLGNSELDIYASKFLADFNNKKFTLELLKKADFGIEDINIKEAPVYNIQNKSVKYIESSRKKYNSTNKNIGNKEFLFHIQESEGTQKMLQLVPFIFRSMKIGHHLFIDEFDARFHPLLTKKIVELYNSKENKNAQLVFITHDTNLLSSKLLRRDQIDFVEKDRYGASHLYSLVEIKGVRNDASFEKDYIQGKYGAIPFIGNLNNLLASE